MLKSTLSFFLALVVAAPALGQSVATLSVQPESKLWIDGTSNKSDWNVSANAFSGHVTMNAEPTADDPGVQEVHLTVVANQILSGKSTIMDRLMHKALMVEEHPEIVYELTGAALTQAGSSASVFMLQTTGNLTLGGVTKPVEVMVEGEMLDGGSVHFTGSHVLLMSDFGLTPPVAMYGALRTSDECTVHFDLVVGPEQ
jgi:polyisoprenoid-binding protein YceI